MNDEIPSELRDFDFAEIGNNQQNIWRLRDELNATRRWLRENTVNPEEETLVDRELKPGVTFNGVNQYRLDGKLIKKEEAFL